MSFLRRLGSVLVLKVLKLKPLRVLGLSSRSLKLSLKLLLLKILRLRLSLGLIDSLRLGLMDSLRLDLGKFDYLLGGSILYGNVLGVPILGSGPILSGVEGVGWGTVSLLKCRFLADRRLA